MDKKCLHKIIYLTLGFAFALSYSASFGDDFDIVKLKKRCLLISKIEEQIGKATKDDKQKVAEKSGDIWDDENIFDDELGAPFFKLYRARLHFIAGEVVEARNILAALVNKENIDVLPEAGVGFYKIDIVLEHVLDEYNPQLYSSKYDGAHAALTPLSSIRTSHDGTLTRKARKKERFIYTTGHRPFIATPHINTMHSIGQYFSKMKMYKQAANAYRESIYTITYDLDITSDYDGLYAGRWIDVAEAEWHAGNISGMANAIAKAIAFSGERKFEEAVNLLVKYSKQEIPEQAPEPVPDSENLQVIARLYAESNMHPRAIALIEKYRDVIGKEEADKLDAKYKKEWLERLDSYAFGEEDACFLFGQDILPLSEKERLEIKIPPLCSEKAIKIAHDYFVKQIKLDVKKDINGKKTPRTDNRKTLPKPGTVNKSLDKKETRSTIKNEPRSTINTGKSQKDTKKKQPSDNAPKEEDSGSTNTDNLPLIIGGIFIGLAILTLITYIITKSKVKKE